MTREHPSDLFRWPDVTESPFSSLLPRHTHFGCDQVFSRHSTWLHSHDAKTLPTMLSGFVESWLSQQGMGRVKTAQMFLAADVKLWLKDHLDPRLHHHTTAHQYVFEKQVYHGTECAVMTAKNFSVSQEKDWKIVGPLLRVCFTSLPLHHFLLFVARGTSAGCWQC